MKFLAATFLTAVSSLVAAPASATDMATCHALNANYKADNPGATKASPEVRACIKAALAALEQKAIAERDRALADIEAMDRNAAKLPAD